MKSMGFKLLKQINEAKSIFNDRNTYTVISRSVGRATKIIMIITVVFVLFMGCLGQKQHLSDPFEKGSELDKNFGVGNKPDKVNEKEIGSEELDPIKKRIDEMTLEEKIGQMIIVGFDGYELDDILKALIYDYHVSGFIFMKGI